MTIKKILARIALTTAIIGPALSGLAIVSSTSAFAGDCKKIKFQIVNERLERIRVNHVRISSHQGTWNENLHNKRIPAGDTWNSKKRRLNHLDSGIEGTFVLSYDRQNAGTGGWVNNLTAAPVVRTCRDDTKIQIRVN